MHHPSKPPLMEPASVLSILISAEFLQMTALVKLCIQFVREHINEVVRLPLDMSCVSDESVSQARATRARRARRRGVAVAHHGRRASAVCPRRRHGCMASAVCAHHGCMASA
eukprot:2601071-Prymnesium_polylepis.1